MFYKAKSFDKPLDKWKFSKDSEVDKIYCAPGNGGTELFSTNLDIFILYADLWNPCVSL